MQVSEFIELKPIGFVKTDWIGEKAFDRTAVSKIVFHCELAEALEGLEDFSHIYVIFWMNEISKKERVTRKVHPRGRRDMPLLGVFATRSPHRPNPIGLTLVELLKVERNTVFVLGLDAFGGSPVLDVKPFDCWDTAVNAQVPQWWTILEEERSSNHGRMMNMI